MGPAGGEHGTPQWFMPGWEAREAGKERIAGSREGVRGRIVQEQAKWGEIKCSRKEGWKDAEKASQEGKEFEVEGKKG